MTNNDILRRLRYAFDFNDAKVLELFESAGFFTNKTDISTWLKKEEEEGYILMQDMELAYFLNGLINDRRGKREGTQTEVEKELTNNIIFRKLKIALNLKDTDIIEIMDLADMRISKHEISSFFRAPGQKQYRMCKDQFLRNFIYGIQLKYRNVKK